ncbi:hypothetical protein OG455_11945 [Kitasatospora sp. NBC_01287]|uniref:hypothetical protein n=1 Tax=Kitasatospora sp. NBC_01287 TaxID=2903573 RepID=UPI00225B606F|nr:hypothetical protein [Kitasatospora sp. NBC_01287]MCX4746228.1 hypothetical protein [Kitasatospora sp. NBC_01287]
MTISSGSWAAEPDDVAVPPGAGSASGPGAGPGAGPGSCSVAEHAEQAEHADEEYRAQQERHVRQVFAELEFPLYAVDRAGHGARSGDRAPGAGADSDAMSGYEAHNGEITWIELRSGDWTSLEGPYVTVRTYQPGVERYAPLPELEELVERERDRVYEQLGIDEGDSPGRVRALREWISVMGEPTAVQLHEESGAGSGTAARARTVWAGKLLLHGSVVLVCGRGVDPADIELEQLADPEHERFTVGRTELLRQVAERRRHRLARLQRSHLALTGLDAHRALLEFSVERALAHQAYRLSRGRTRMPRRLRVAEQPEQWEAAVRQQMHYASESYPEAYAAVGSMVGQLLLLAERADWLVGGTEGRAALEEVIRYTAFASQVPSLPAQRAWEQLARRRSATDQEPAAAEELESAEQAWLGAWEQWRQERGRGR